MVVEPGWSLTRDLGYPVTLGISLSSIVKSRAATMDPLSITASLIAVLQIGGTVISALYEYRKGVKHASKDAAKIIDELNSLRIVLESLLSVAEKEESATERSSRLSTIQQLAKPNGELERCKANLVFLNAKLQPESGWKTLKQALVWPLKEAEVKNTLDDIQRSKSTLHFALSTDEAVVTLEIHDGVKYLTEQLAESRFGRRVVSVINLGTARCFPAHTRELRINFS